ncbi:MAG: hypothetical protein K5871_07635 [Lachnospiraceae bacterium]|nr:hypothetical protein [Lachnospiraceae bacterium]
MSVYVIGKEPGISIVAKSLYDSDGLSVIAWDEIFRNSSNGLIINKQDTVILAFNNKKMQQAVKTWILAEFSVCEDNILEKDTIDSFVLPRMKVDRVFSVESNYKGLVLGLSHAKVGILPELVPIQLADLTVSAQDIFYNFETLEYAQKKYGDRLTEIQYTIYDVFDYTYLNYDCSLSNNAISYFEWGGFASEHNFSRNKNVTVSYLEAQKSIMTNCIIDTQIDLVERLFDRNKYIKNQLVWGEDVMNRRWKPCSEELISAYDGDNSLVSKRFEKTIEENTVYLRKTIEMLYRINPNMKIFLIIFPHLPMACKKINEKYSLWKDMFYSYMSSLENKYNVNFLDFKICDEFDDKLYFDDCEHLNYFGARKFTTLLNDVIKW